MREAPLLLLCAKFWKEILPDRILCLVAMSFKSEGAIRTFPEKQ